MPVSRTEPEIRAALVARLRVLRDSSQLTGANIVEAARGVGVTERTVWRWLVAGGPAKLGPAPYVLSAEDHDEFAAANGNIAAAWRHRAAAGARVPPLRTYQEAFRRELLPGQRASITEGVAGRRRHEVYLRWDPTYRNAAWEADHKELPVLVMAPKAQRPGKPWVTMFLDGYSRLIMGWAISMYPSSATVLAALRSAITIDPERGPFGGVPEALRWDNGLEFAAEALQTAGAVLGCKVAKMPAYTPHLRGKIERSHRTIQDSFVAGLPFHTDGPTTADGRLYGPPGDPMSLALFIDHFAEWVRSYNSERPHEGLGGMTPLDKWCGDPTPLRTIPSKQLRWLLLAGQRRRILKDGIHFQGLMFIAPELNGRVGQDVEVRFMPHDLRYIEVFQAGEWLCTAKPQGLLTADERDAVLARRRADAAELGRRQRRASRRARVRLAPATGTEPVVETTTLSAAQARTDRRRDDENLRRLARTDLLGLEKIANLYRKPEDQQ